MNTPLDSYVLRVHSRILFVDGCPIFVSSLLHRGRADRCGLLSLIESLDLN